MRMSQRIPWTILQPTCRRCIRRSFSSHDTSHYSSTTTTSFIHSILARVQQGTISIQDAEQTLLQSTLSTTTDTTLKTLSSFANIDHHRSIRTGFPEAVFGSGKTPLQISQILDSMAEHINRSNSSERSNATDYDWNSSSKMEKSRKHGTVLATRITPSMYDQIQSYPFQHGCIQYHPIAQIITMTASSFISKPPLNSSSGGNDDDATQNDEIGTIVVACAGTTDVPIAEEAAVTLEATRECHVERIYDVGVAGLHRIINALPKLRHPKVQCILVVAGMDGALPSVVAGLVSTPVIAIPTSIGYGACFGGVSALLTMLNSCSPGIGVVNIDNGFGGAALAYKCLKNAQK